jgi:hypothetical protein
MSESVSAYTDDDEEVKNSLPVRKREGAVALYVSEFALLFPEFDRRDNGTRKELEDMVNVLYDANGEAGMNFISSFKLLCRDANELRQLFGLAHDICGRWGGRGCDLISAFYYNNLDLVKFKRTIYVFVNCPFGDIQAALEEFWWLMGIGGYNALLDNPDMFGFFESLMTRKGLQACRLLAEMVGKGPQIDLNLAWCLGSILDAGNFEMARSFRAISGIETMEAGARMEIVKRAVELIRANDFEECGAFLKSRGEN